ncbi:MAG: response regulator [Nitrospirales bacterium]
MEQLSLSPSLATHLPSSGFAPFWLNKSHEVKMKDPQCLLIVGNNSKVVGLLKEALQEWGYDVVTAGNGWEALIVLGRHSVSGILVDMDMPIMDGRTMLNELRWLGYQIPVLFMSEKSDERTRHQVLMEGGQGFLSKPPHLPSLQQTCSQIFRKYGVEKADGFYFPASLNKK